MSRGTAESGTVRVCAVIPARGGSKGLPRKNLRQLGGQTLIERAVRSVADAVDLVVVSTDDLDIAAVSRQQGAMVVGRPAEIAGDTASSESALLHALEQLAGDGIRPEVLVFVQATSPFIHTSDVARAVELVESGVADVAFSVTASHAHLWCEGPDGAEAINHDMTQRQRRQDRRPEFVETGAFYAMRAEGFVEHRHRFFGRVRLIHVDPFDALEIDDEHDLRRAELIEQQRATMSPIVAMPARAVVTDFDGVHTNDSVVVDQHGVESVVVSRSDGMGVARLRRAGIPFLILSTESNDVVKARAAKLGVDVVSGCDDKLAALRAWAASRNLDLADIAYLGNDINDVECLRAVGWGVAVADARAEAINASSHVLRFPGGSGAVRELANRVLAGSVTSENLLSPTRRA